MSHSKTKKYMKKLIPILLLVILVEPTIEDIQACFSSKAEVMHSEMVA